MKVLISAYACDPYHGSEPGVGWNWAVQMAKYNEVWVLTRKNNQSSIEAYLEQHPMGNPRFIYYDLPRCLRFWKKGRRGIHLYYKLWQRYIYRRLKKEGYQQFDLIHHVTFNEFRTPGYLWKLNKPFIFGPIGGGQEFPKGFERYLEGNRLKELFRKIVNQYYKRGMVLKKVFKKAKYVLVADPSTFKFLNCSGGKFLKILETGINEDKIFEKKPCVKTKTTILWVGNLIYRKGLRLLLEAFERIENKQDFEIRIFGSGPLLDIYKKYAEEKQISGYIKFEGKVSYSDMMKAYQDADIFVFTSLRDTSGNVVLEAMANSLPVITLDHHGASDIVSEDCGIKILPLNPEYVINELAEGIQRLAKDSVKWEMMGEQARKRIEDVYLWEKKGLEMQQIYEKAVGKI